MACQVEALHIRYRDSAYLRAGWDRDMLLVQAHLVWQTPQTPEPVCCPSWRCVACHCRRQLRCMYLQARHMADIVPFTDYWAIMAYR